MGCLLGPKIFPWSITSFTKAKPGQETVEGPDMIDAPLEEIMDIKCKYLITSLSGVWGNGKGGGGGGGDSRDIPPSCHA